jgi:hypothetical protein
MLDAHVYTLQPGARGFDTNTPLTARLAQAFKSAQYDFVGRYCWRKSHNRWDLSTAEAQIILDAGLALFPVQHVHPDSEKAHGWQPDADLGLEYGNTAAEHCQLIGLPAGGNVFLDLEGVGPDVDEEDVIAYCNTWHARVAEAGYVPGLYVGFNPGLGPRALYRALRFTHYWGAYNDQNVPIVRGFQMQQHERKISDIPAGVPRDFAFDTNTVQLDRLRGLPIALIKSPPNFADVSSGSSSTVGN